MSGPTVMLTLGEFNFELATATYQEFQRQTEYRWPTQERFGQRPVRQFVGEGDDAITLPGVVFPAWTGGRFQVEQMRTMAGRGQPLQMIAGDGTLMGRWVILSIGETGTNFADFGVPLKQEYTLGLAKFDDQVPVAGDGLMLPDADLASDAEADAKAAADAGGIADQAASMAGAAAAALNDAATNISNLAANVQNTVAPAIAAVRQAMTAAANVKTAAADAKGTVKRLGKIKDLASAESALGGLMRTASSASAAASGAGATVLGVSGQLSGADPAAAATVKRAAVTVNKFTNGLTNVRRQTDGLLNTFK